MYNVQRTWIILFSVLLQYSRMSWQAKENEGEGEREEAIYNMNTNAYRFSATHTHRLKMQSNKKIIL